MKTVKVRKASPIANAEFPGTTIIIDGLIDNDEASIEQVFNEFTKDADILASALFNSLPGGVLDALIAKMLERRRSHFIVPSWATRKNND